MSPSANSAPKEGKDIHTKQIHVLVTEDLTKTNDLKCKPRSARIFMFCSLFISSTQNGAWLIVDTQWFFKKLSAASIISLSEEFPPQKTALIPAMILTTSFFHICHLSSMTLE